MLKRVKKAIDNRLGTIFGIAFLGLTEYAIATAPYALIWRILPGLGFVFAIVFFGFFYSLINEGSKHIDIR